MKIEAVPTYNTNKDFHPNANVWLWFIVEFNGVRLYHAGDTDHIAEMNDFKLNIALLPISGTYVMTAGESVEAAISIGPKLAIPMHIGAIVGSDQDAARFKEALEGKIEVAILSKEKWVEYIDWDLFINNQNEWFGFIRQFLLSDTVSKSPVATFAGNW